MTLQQQAIMILLTPILALLVLSVGIGLTYSMAVVWILLKDLYQSIHNLNFKQTTWEQEKKK